MHASDKDSLGYYLTALSRSSTIFLANDEEYLTLRNSGLIELIESDQLVSVLQERTAGNKAFKKQEDKIIEAEKAVAALVAEKCGKTPVGEVLFQGYPHGRYSTYVACTTADDAGAQHHWHHGRDVRVLHPLCVELH